MNYEEYRLCFVKDSWAYFTARPLCEVSGNDWDDAPYQYNAGPPCTRDGGDIYKVAWDGNFDLPHDTPGWSADQINAGAAPWLTEWVTYGTGVVIAADVTLVEFRALIKKGDGAVYEERQ